VAVFNVNSAALSVYVAVLQHMKKSALPVAIRQTLNDMAFDTKTNTMPAEAHKDFIHRKDTFFKANSRAEVAKGFDVNTMRSQVYFKPKEKDKSHSVEDLEEQEEGTPIKYSRAFVGLATSRSSNRWNKNIRNRNRRNNMPDAIDAKNYVSKYAPTDKSKYVAAAIWAAKTGALVIGNKVNGRGNKMAWRPDHLNRFNGDTFVVATPLFAVKRARIVKPPATHFMRDASEESLRKGDKFFAKNVNLQIAKIK